MLNKLSFQDPLWFALFGLVPVLMLLCHKFWRHQFPVLLLPHTQGQKGLQAREWLTPPELLFFLRLLTISFLILGLANLKTARETRHAAPALGIDIVLALDISGSMMLEDIKPNRLEALKDVLTRFVAGRAEDRFGLVLYAGESINWCPITQDYGFLLAKLREMDGEALADGTAIGLGLASAVNALKGSSSKGKVVILLTDGENNAGFVHPLTAAELAKEHQVKVYTIGIGTTGLAPLPLTDLNGNKVYQYVPVKIDEAMLTKIAERTGGAYFRATNAKALEAIYQEIDQLEKTPHGIRKETVYHSEYRVFLLIALLLFLLELVLRFTFFRSLAS
ncbi:VWA domain-containing protein [Pontibacter sp. SGAir0037]|uniref:vWA domain-containing protein n=1 Tax=Pontibacter sp. SGAir0037 TaxID=2571030 RepID=UPI00143CFD8F|nr:VWA domain-containing protein [Pontibacter sp. SGAir0037]